MYIYIFYIPCINGGGGGGVFWVADSERAAALHRVAVGFGTARDPMGHRASSIEFLRTPTNTTFDGPVLYRIYMYVYIYYIYTNR